MAFSRFCSSGPFASSLLILFVSILSLIHSTVAIVTATSGNTKYVQASNDQGDAIWLKDSRKPALYTQDFGDCLGSSLINVTRFDAAFYQDNMTVLFHLEGNTNVANESLMCVFAYGQARFDLTFNPCNAQIYSLCPMNRSVPIEANGIIPVSQSDVAGIPPIALSIPDFEGQAILRVFANSTQSEIGCYSALVTNGATFSHPDAVGSVLGLFIIMAIASSAATAIYGDDVPTMRTHYAHSLSVLVLFSVFHHIFYTGALSVNWPSVLPAFWSNFAWTGGMIYSDSMQNSINKLIRNNKGNTSMVGAAGSGATADSLGGGYKISQIYKRSVPNVFLWNANSLDNHKSLLKSRDVERRIVKRALANSTNGFSWYGLPTKPGLPLPGNFSGFAGTLAEEGIPATNAFMTGFLWFLISLAVVVASVVCLKWVLEGLTKYKITRRDRLAYFREHWIGFIKIAVLRTMLVAFFMMIYLSLFQFTYKGSGGAAAVAAIVFVFFLGLLGAAGYACYYRLRWGHYETKLDRLYFEKTKAFGLIPWIGVRLGSHRSEKSRPLLSTGSVRCWTVQYIDENTQRIEVQQDEDYIQKFGWLSARFRRTKWWFFLIWLAYEFIRACIYGGAAGHPMTQVFLLLVVEIIAFVAFAILRPFEGTRLNALVVYLLGFSKVATLALSAAFDIRFNLARIPTTVIGIVIIVIQGILACSTLVAIVIGTFSSYMSLTRNHENFKPQRWEGFRQRYFAHLQKTVKDLPPSPPPVPEEPKSPGFTVKSVRRCPKIEDSDQDYVGLMGSHNSVVHPLNTYGSRYDGSRNSSQSLMQSGSSLPFGARSHRASWSTRDFTNWSEEQQRSSRDYQLLNRFGTPSKDSDSSLRETANTGKVPTPIQNMRPLVPLSVPKLRTGEKNENGASMDERD
ncbi:MAG: hypothetical protein Q9167_004648 [Letrouitia subvulpina]